MMMSRLKEATRPRHEAVEARLGLMRLTSTLEGYARSLRLFYGLHRAAEKGFSRVSGWDAVGIDPAERRKTPLLEADLARLGMVPAQVAGLPECPILPPIDGLPSALGMMYVLEGSTLGGRHITRAVEANLGLRPGDGCSYFASYGDRVGAMWRAFGAAVDAYAADDEAVRDAVERSADATFAAVDGWFTAPPAGPSRA
ncbi:biliverdin-producing heme oxygenase [Paludisphaera sp.]|uniref:biliverdin-producing heme oxygenase n=1 Tax=Paludisphaera sp. TaxID=2017432 RepID=UPI00301D8032